MMMMMIRSCGTCWLGRDIAYAITVMTQGGLCVVAAVNTFKQLVYKFTWEIVNLFNYIFNKIHNLNKTHTHTHKMNVRKE